MSELFVRIDEWKPPIDNFTKDYESWRFIKGVILLDDNAVARFHGTGTTMNLLLTVTVKRLVVSDIFDFPVEHQGKELRRKLVFDSCKEIYNRHFAEQKVTQDG